ncbi:aladin [Hordeum vulgare]|nr:aladin [Hordeum vulgare]
MFVLATVHHSFSSGGYIESKCIYSADSSQEDRYKSSFESSPAELVESILTPAERSGEELKGALYESDAKGSRVPNHKFVSEHPEDTPSSSTFLQVKVILDISGVNCSCILSSEHRKNVKALEWRSGSLKMISVHCKREICLW